MESVTLFTRSILQSIDVRSIVVAIGTLLVHIALLVGAPLFALLRYVGTFLYSTFFSNTVDTTETDSLIEAVRSALYEEKILNGKRKISYFKDLEAEITKGVIKEFGIESVLTYDVLDYPMVLRMSPSLREKYIEYRAYKRRPIKQLKLNTHRDDAVNSSFGFGYSVGLLSQQVKTCIVDFEKTKIWMSFLHFLHRQGQLLTDLRLALCYDSPMLFLTALIEFISNLELSVVLEAVSTLLLVASVFVVGYRTFALSTSCVYGCVSALSALSDKLFSHSPQITHKKQRGPFHHSTLTVGERLPPTGDFDKAPIVTVL